MANPFLDRVSAALQALTGRNRNTPIPGWGQMPPGAHPEIGWGGTRVFGGIVQDEYNPDLQGLKAVQTADKMRRTLAQVRAVEKAITLPITSTVWMVEEPDGAGSAEKEAAELLRANLLGGMETSWDQLLREACLAVYFGWRVPEIVWDEDPENANLIRVRKIAGRNPELVERWLYHPNGELAGYLYSGNRPTGNGLDNWGTSTSTNVRVPIPIEKTLHFVYDQENDNPQGFGLWRSMYTHWYILQACFKIVGIGIERSLLGVPVGKLHAGAQDDDKTAMLTMLSRLRAAEDAAVVLMAEQAVEWFESQRNPMDAMPFIDLHLRMIALAGLAQFLNLGMGSAGTQALGTVHAELFQQAENGIARWIAQTINAQLVKRWALLNYGEGLRPPVVKHKPIKAHDLGAWATALQGLVSSGLLHPVVEDEEKLRAEFELPAIPREQLEQLEVERKAQEQEKHRAELAVLQSKGNPDGGDGKPGDQKHHELDGCDSHRFADAGDERAERVAREQAFADGAAALLTDVQAGYLAKLRPLVDKAQSDDKIAQGIPLGQLADVAVPGTRRYEEFVRTFLWDVFREGQTALAAETGQEIAGRAVPNKTRMWVNAKAAVIAADHVAQLRTAVLNRVLTGIQAELPADQIFSEAGAAAVEELSANAQRDWAAAAAEICARVGQEMG